MVQLGYTPHIFTFSYDRGTGGCFKVSECIFIKVYSSSGVLFYFFCTLNWFLGVQLAHLEPPHNNIKRHKAKSVGMEWTDTAAVCSKSLAGGK